MQHFYVYYTKIHNDKEITVYERTCGTAEAADSRVKELQSRESVNRAFWSNDVVKGAFY